HYTAYRKSLLPISCGDTGMPTSLGNTLYIDKPERINDFQLKISTIDGVYSARTPLKFEGAISCCYPINLQSKYQIH
ncbi:MAG: hypothetical protein ACTMIA_16580, partial [Vibrio sp.]